MIGNEPAFYYLALPLFLGIGLFFAWVVSRISARRVEQEPNERYQKLQTKISYDQMCRRNKMVKVIEQIGGPECPDGTYSPRQVALWREYNALEKHDEMMKRKEIAALVEAR